MTTCRNCGAELLGNERFCASCGQLVLSDAKDPAPPPSNVNPFAATASPTSNPSQPAAAAAASPTSKPSQPAAAAAARPPAPASSPAMKAIDAAALASNPVALAPKPDSRPPPPKSEAPGPTSPRVSPLAMSNGVSGPTPFSEALEKARKAVAKKDTPEPAPAVRPEEPPKPKKQGTQLMANAPKIPPKKIIPKTVAMDPPPRAERPVAPSSRANAAPQSVAPGRMPQSVPPGRMPQSVPPGRMPQSMPPATLQPAQPPPAAPQSVAPGGMPSSVAAPGSIGLPPGSMPRQYPISTQAPLPQPPPQSYAGYPYQPQPQPQPQAQPQQQGWQPPPQAVPAPYGNYQFGYPPGARVHVTWSNGQRYPATVTQVTGTQCLVVFPDGQQHWVEMQYLSPG